MSNVVPIKGAERPPQAEQSRMDTLILTLQMISAWKLPPFQRPLTLNDKVRSVIEIIKKTEVIEGVITLGILRNETALYLVDGQHRIEAFKLSEMPEVIADVRIMRFQTIADMADEFLRLNSSLVRMRPDDLLRAMEESTPMLKQIRKACDFVGYDKIRRGTSGSGPVVGMSALVRCWTSSGYETPSSGNTHGGAMRLVESIDQTSMQNLIAFLATAHSAWGRDPEYYRLWSNLNMTLCMWLWNRLVIDRDRSGAKRYSTLNIPEFKKCLMSLSANSDYVEWLTGRNLTDRDRSPCYNRIKSIFSRRMVEDGKEGGKRQLPSPAWASN